MRMRMKLFCKIENSFSNESIWVAKWKINLVRKTGCGFECFLFLFRVRDCSSNTSEMNSSANWHFCLSNFARKMNDSQIDTESNKKGWAMWNLTGKVMLEWYKLVKITNSTNIWYDGCDDTFVRMGRTTYRCVLAEQVPSISSKRLMNLIKVLPCVMVDRLELYSTKEKNVLFCL